MIKRFTIRQTICAALAAALLCAFQTQAAGLLLSYAEEIGPGTVLGDAAGESAGTTIIYHPGDGPGTALSGPSADAAGTASDAAVPQDASVIAASSGIGYDTLRALIIAGNPSLAQNSYYSSKERLEYQISVLEEERKGMLTNKEFYAEDDPEAATEYGRTATAMGNSLKRLRKQLSAMDSGSSSIESTIDSLERTARSRLNSYNRMAAQQTSKEKSLAAAEKSYENTVLRFSTGAATAAAVESAYNRLLLQQNELESYRQQVSSLRKNLLDMFGLSDDGTAVIAASPAPDLAVIAAIDFEADKAKAIGNDADVQRARHSSANSTAAMQMKEMTEAEAMGLAEASITDSYRQLQASLTEYQAAQAAWTAAQSDLGKLQRRKQAGMLTQADELSGEAKYYSAQAQFTSASIALLQDYESYCWEVEGVS